MIKTIGRYQIKEEINRGGMGAILRASDPRFERDVAIKILPPTLLNEPAIRRRFEREAKIVATLQHPGILPVHDFGEERGIPYLVMRFLEGGSLQDRLEQNGAMEYKEIVQLMHRLGPALDSAHQQGVIHRDLKPANILFDQYGYAFLADFGIARVADTTIALTAGNAAMGTPPYMSPEQVRAEDDVDHRCDVYALGIILFEMFTGEVPYRAETATKTMLMHVLRPVPSILDFRPDLPIELDLIIQKALAKNKEDRYNSAAELVEALEQLETNGTAPPIIEDTAILPTPQPEKPKQPIDDEDDESLEEFISRLEQESGGEPQRKLGPAPNLYKRPPPKTAKNVTPRKEVVQREVSEIKQDPQSETLDGENDLVDRVLMHYKSREERLAERQEALKELYRSSEQKSIVARQERERQAQQSIVRRRNRRILTLLFVLVIALALYYILIANPDFLSSF